MLIGERELQPLGESLLMALLQGLVSLFPAEGCAQAMMAIDAGVLIAQ